MSSESLRLCPREQRFEHCGLETRGVHFQCHLHNALPQRLATPAVHHGHAACEFPPDFHSDVS